MGDYEQVLASDEVDAVYVSTVHTVHARLKPPPPSRPASTCFVEKPLTPNSGTTMALLDLAARSGKVLPRRTCTASLSRRPCGSSVLGRGRDRRASSTSTPPAFDTGAREGRLFDTATAGGGILDVGCYPLSLARFRPAPPRAVPTFSRPRSPAAARSRRPGSTNGPPPS